MADDWLLPSIDGLLSGFERGFSCGLSISGTLVDLLERHAPDALEALGRCAGSPHAEVLAAPYHHGLAAVLPDEREYTDEIVRHRCRMEALFGVTPTVFAPPDLCMTRRMTAAVAASGCTAILTEPRWCLPAEMDPTLVYRSGEMIVLHRHCHHSEDLAARFLSSVWDRDPLQPEVWAGRIADTCGECTLIGLDLDRFGEGDGLFDFVRTLPAALSRRGVRIATPTQVIAASPPARCKTGREIDWRAPDGGESCLETALQHSAASALVRAAEWLPEREVWRHLSSTDLFRTMAVRSGGCGRRRTSVSPEETVEGFNRFMLALSALEERAAARLRSRKAALTLRTLPPDRAFVFSRDGDVEGPAVFSLAECVERLLLVSERVVAAHLTRQDFSRWCRDVLEDGVLAERVAHCRDRDDLVRTMQKRIDELALRRRSSSPVDSLSSA
jgi:hypothetical protein